VGGIDAFTGWDAGAEPCAAGGWDDEDSGYVGVLCDRAGGRVVYVDGSHAGLGCDAALFAPLGALRWLALEQNAALHGDVASLGGLVELRYLGLSDTAVHGAPGSLVGLRHLGEQVTTTVPGYSGLTGVLHLARTRVAGPVAALQALPGLGSSWGSWEGQGLGYDFTGCDDYGAASLDTCDLVAGASGVAGQDDCACCAESVEVRDQATGCCGPCGTSLFICLHTLARSAYC
jgi:hypothetical protein